MLPIIAWGWCRLWNKSNCCSCCRGCLRCYTSRAQTKTVKLQLLNTCIYMAIENYHTPLVCYKRKKTQLFKKVCDGDMA